MKIAKWVAALLILVLVQAPLSFSQPNSVVINEFIPNPTGSDTAAKPEGEWVELYNPTSGDLDVGGWILKDSYDTHILEVNSNNTNTSGTVVKSKSYLVVYRDGDSDFSLNQSEDQVRLFDGSDNLIDSVSYSGSIEEGKSWSLIGNEWIRGTVPTPGAKNAFPAEETDEQQQEPQPTISFSAPSAVSTGTPFSVSVSLKNFKPGTYALKVLIGKGGKFIYGNTKGASGWLTQNGPWKYMPQVTVGSSGSGSKTVQAKTDDDAVAGKYLIKVRAHKDGDNFDSGTKALKVTGAAVSAFPSSAAGDSSDPERESSFAEAAEGEGEVLGEESPSRELKLNFYIILGIFGMLVGSGGLILAFRRGAQQPQTPNTPEPERGPL